MWLISHLYIPCYNHICAYLCAWTDCVHPLHSLLIFEFLWIVQAPGNIFSKENSLFLSWINKKKKTSETHCGSWLRLLKKWESLANSIVQSYASITFDLHINSQVLIDTGFRASPAIVHGSVKEAIFTLTPSCHRARNPVLSWMIVVFTRP